MTENGNKRPRGSLYQGDKIRKKAHKKSGLEAEDASSSVSIVSFFNKVSPSLVPCPLCGQVVSRYQINQHIDESCQQNGGGDDDVILIEPTSGVGAGTPGGSWPSCSSRDSAKGCATLEENPTPPEGCSLKRKLGDGEQMSPYFKRDTNLRGSDSTPAVQAVKNISLGSLASKLSRRRCAQGGNAGHKSAERCLTPDSWGGARECHLGDAALEISSQKENCLPFSESEEQQSPKEKLTSVSRTPDIVCNCDPEAVQAGVEDATHVLIPWGDLDGNDLAVPPGEDGKQPKSPAHPVPNPALRVACSAARGERGLSESESQGLSSSEPVLLTPAKPMPFRRKQKSSFRRGGAKQLPVEDRPDLRNEMATGCTTPSDKVTSGNTSSTVPGTLSNPSGSGGDSERHPYYLQNFLRVMQAVLEESDDMRLFDEHELLLASQFYTLSGTWLPTPVVRPKSVLAYGKLVCQGRKSKNLKC